MSAALPVHVGLVSESASLSAVALAPVAAALQSQAQRDFAPAWKTSAVVAAFPTRADIPQGYWPIIVQDKLDDPGALGYHTDLHRQPVSYVEYTPDWSVTCSHELLEMLADPFGNRLWAAAAPDRSAARVRILVEVCDPCEAFTYDIGGVKVSDFALPSWYHTAKRFGHSYSFCGNLGSPRAIREGGYVSWVSADGVWHQSTWWGSAPETKTLGRHESFARPGDSLREGVDRYVREHRPQA